MKRFISALVSAAVVISSATGIMPPQQTATAENPIIQTAFTPDPAPVVFGDELWVFTGRDRNADNDFYYMTGWQAFSTTDMKNWTNHGCFLEDDDYSWCNANDAWASQCIERNGKYYFYFTTTNKTGGGRAIGVGVADRPEGPYKDVLGKPLCGPNWDYIDPTVMIDDDGQAWLMFGNPKCYYVKLKEDMVTLDGPIQQFDMTTSAFGQGKNGSAYGEGPWICKHGDRYYLVYAGFYGSDGGESICYSYGPSVTGPWTFGGKITPESNCFTTHGGIIDYKDHSYLFYHKNGLQGGGSFKRSAAVEEFKFNSDGTIPMVKPTDAGPDQLEALDPFKRVEAETGSWFSGVEVEPSGNGDQCVGYIQNGDYIKISGVDFGNGADKFTVSAGSDTDGGSIKLHIDSIKGEVIGTVDIGATGGWKNWEEYSCDTNVSGEHDLFLEFVGGSDYLFNLDWWKFEGDGGSSDPMTDDGIIFRNTFENGTESWNGRGSAKTAASSDYSYQGSKSLYVTNREAAWNGTAKELNYKFKAGTSYSFSANVLYDSGKTATDTFFMKLQYTDENDEVQYSTIAQGTAVKGDWIQLANTNYTIPSGATEMYVYIETEDSKNNFYVDDIVAAADGTVIEGAGKHDKLVIGDVDSDGCITSFDLALAKKGLISGFSSNYAKLAADVDKSTEFEINDVVLLMNYLLGNITEFPDNTPVPPEPVPSNFDYNANLQFSFAPDSYQQPCSQAGKITKEYYTGIRGNKALNVYTPYNYDPSKKYNIFYLMHGGGENEDTIFGSDVNLQYILDHMIMNGDLEPLIVVTPTFNGNNSKAENFYEEFRESVVPFVEGKYSTYAESTTPAGIEASRMHRAYGGFSMGSVSTWAVMKNCLDMVGYFMPLSGDHWDGNSADDKARSIANAIDKSGLSKREYFIFAATGSKDIAYPNISPQVEAMKNYSQFEYTSDFSKGNFYFMVAPELEHWWGYVKHYIYDGLPYFFHEGQ